MAIKKQSVKKIATLKNVIRVKNDDNTLIATPTIAKKVAAAKELQGQIKMLEKQLLAVRKEIEAKMDEHEILADKKGIELVTWKFGSDIDKEYLQANYPEIYDECKVIKEDVNKKLLKAAHAEVYAEAEIKIKTRRFTIK